MDNKQITIYNKILKKFELKGKIKFIQHRNLKEFKYFKIERINPNHHIILYGYLKKNKNHFPNKLIKVGEIFIGFSTLLININLLLKYSDLFLLTISMFFINCLFFYVFGDIDIMRCLIANWYRRFFGRWENHLSSSLS